MNPVFRSADLLVNLLRGANPPDGGDPLLRDLLDALRQNATAPEVAELESRILAIWSTPPKPGARILMREGVEALNDGNLARATEAFNALIKAHPEFAEGWNKRATLRFVAEDFEGSAADIHRVLALEPRHFGALAGLGQIFVKIGDNSAALRAFDAALALNPHMEGVRLAADALRSMLTRSGDQD